MRVSKHSHCLFGALAFHRREQVKKQWCNPAKRNSLALPFLCFILMSFLATKWYGEPSSGDIAKVLFWMGTIPLAAMTVFTIGRYYGASLIREVVIARKLG